MNVTNTAINGPDDLYQQILRVKNCPNTFTYISKKQAKECNIPWSFVENSCQILGMKLERNGKFGYVIGL
jgi:hypothetical protein